MFRVTLGLATATFFALAASPASAGGWGSNWGGGGWGGGGCCNSGYAYQQPHYYVQPAPIVVQAPVQQFVVAAPPPVFVQAPPQQIIVQQSQPEVIFQQAAVAPVASYTVNQGPVYAGPQVIGYPQNQYYGDEPVRPYPYVSGYSNPNRYYGRPLYRGWRGAGYRGYRGYGYRNYGIYRGGYSHRYANYKRYHRGGVPPHAYHGVPKKSWH
jgi:hypothetical protein